MASVGIVIQSVRQLSLLTNSGKFPSDSREGLSASSVFSSAKQMPAFWERFDEHAEGLQLCIQCSKCDHFA